MASRTNQIQAMGVSKAVSTPGTREDGFKAGKPNTATTATTTAPPRKCCNYNNPAANSTTVTSNCTNIVRNSNHRNHARDDDDGDGHDDDGRQYQEEVSGVSLHAEEPSKFRALAARANYLAQDRSDIQYAVKEVAR